jgi:hypothetical protein
MTLKEQNNYHKQNCEFLIIKCKYCYQGIKKKDFELHDKTCDFYPVKCSN